jgi:hypothetical protein
LFVLFCFVCVCGVTYAGFDFVGTVEDRNQKVVLEVFDEDGVKGDELVGRGEVKGIDGVILRVLGVETGEAGEGEEGALSRGEEVTVPVYGDGGDGQEQVGEIVVKAIFGEAEAAGGGTEAAEETERDVPTKIHIAVMKGRVFEKQDFVGKGDPYVIVRYNGQEQKTQVRKNTQDPEWNEGLFGFEMIYLFIYLFICLFVCLFYYLIYLYLFVFRI